MKRKWRCYVCGRRIAKVFALFSLSEEADRVFLVHEDCGKRLDDKPFIVVVKKLKIPFYGIRGTTKRKKCQTY